MYKDGSQGLLAAREWGVGAYLCAEADRKVQQKRAGLLKEVMPSGSQVPARCGRDTPEILAMMVAHSDVLIDFLEGWAPATHRVARPRPRSAPDHGDHALWAARGGKD